MAEPTGAQTMGAAPGAIGVRVRLFASYRESAGRAALERSLPHGARVADLVEALLEQVPALGASRGMVAVNQEYVEHDHELRDGDEVAFIPPVSGGRC